VYACSFSLGPVGAREKEPKREAPKEISRSAERDQTFLKKSLDQKTFG
jgi:hypothetical protein